MSSSENKTRLRFGHYVTIMWVRNGQTKAKHIKVKQKGRNLYATPDNPK